MAECKWCEQEMTSHPDTCAGNTEVEYPDGKKLKPLPYGGPGERCHDCGIARGGNHHPGCDMEKCPRCGGQLISCGCLDEDNENLPEGQVDPQDHLDGEAVTRYLFKHGFIEDHCTLCGNTGWVDTTGVHTPAGVVVGKRQLCLCPNGQAMRRSI